MNIETLKSTLEPIVDKESLATVLLALSEICTDKAQHVEETYKSKDLTKTWDNASAAILLACKNIKV
jgi:hypothetical protein